MKFSKTILSLLILGAYAAPLSNGRGNLDLEVVQNSQLDSPLKEKPERRSDHSQLDSPLKEKPERR
jgi:hypothetical protein